MNVLNIWHLKSNYRVIIIFSIHDHYVHKELVISLVSFKNNNLHYTTYNYLENYSIIQEQPYIITISAISCIQFVSNLVIALFPLSAFTEVSKCGQILVHHNSLQILWTLNMIKYYPSLYVDLQPCQKESEHRIFRSTLNNLTKIVKTQVRKFHFSSSKSNNYSLKCSNCDIDLRKLKHFSPSNWNVLIFLFQVFIVLSYCFNTAFALPMASLSLGSSQESNLPQLNIPPNSGYQIDEYQTLKLQNEGDIKNVQRDNGLQISVSSKKQQLDVEPQIPLSTYTVQGISYSIYPGNVNTGYGNLNMYQPGAMENLPRHFVGYGNPPNQYPSQVFMPESRRPGSGSFPNKPPVMQDDAYYRSVDQLQQGYYQQQPPISQGHENYPNSLSAYSWDYPQVSGRSWPLHERQQAMPYTNVEAYNYGIPGRADTYAGNNRRKLKRRRNNRNFYGPCPTICNYCTKNEGTIRQQPNYWTTGNTNGNRQEARWQQRDASRSESDMRLQENFHQHLKPSFSQKNPSVSALFTYMDTDEDGVISFTELRNYLILHSIISPEPH